MSQKKTAWEIVKLARHPKRMTSRTLIDLLFTDFIEMKGDRLFKDDQSIIGGIAKCNAIPITIIAEEKGKDTEDKIKHNFGMPHPEGYRKAIRLMKQAEKFNRPIITIIDTPGAYPGIEAEERGQARAIAYNIFEMMKLRVPILVIILSEGGSGGALAIGVGDYIMMFENAIYSILSPEGFASILFKDSQQAEKAATMMKLTAKDLLAFNVIDQIILEKEGLHENPLYGIEQLKKHLGTNLTKLMKQNKDSLLKNRYEKFRSIGIYSEEGENNDSSEDQDNI
ncbi:acetyl-CoA carboxylase carboxyltransferase subunit alpha [Mariniplasma anaerobium]|uniref:Acetyl-coenzyme A carboxylase carboxyl transferase subunit alpha n=1 Tax=Mariniplasma anaerobium TaxID=2735436 RepID=A0A7U9TH09_9MOLU|nr:acetyl-CoA carboxylase carboxyltransferase subunit alpha [Mariniplasma anaerobium]BCR36303.1 acetyl-coenzyme A carboxylase carboxyl transferase subunit alpha [Mariniplasma anaerobium]